MIMQPSLSPLQWYGNGERICTLASRYHDLADVFTNNQPNG